MEKIRWSLAARLGPVPVVAQVPDEQHRHQVRGRQRRRGMTRPRLGAAADRVHPQLGGQPAGPLELAVIRITVLLAGRP